jgi:transposase
VIGTLTTTGLGPTVAIEGSVNKHVLLAYLKEECLPSVRKGTVFVMDRLPAHCATSIAELIEDAGCSLVLLPPYSPELSPMEEAISKLKHFMQKAAARTNGALIAAFRWAASLITRQDAVGWFHHAGFEVVRRSS